MYFCLRMLGLAASHVMHTVHLICRIWFVAVAWCCPLYCRALRCANSCFYICLPSHFRGRHCSSASFRNGRVVRHAPVRLHRRQDECLAKHYLPDLAQRARLRHRAVRPVIIQVVSRDAARMIGATTHIYNHKPLVPCKSISLFHWPPHIHTYIHMKGTPKRSIYVYVREVKSGPRLSAWLVEFWAAALLPDERVNYSRTKRPIATTPSHTHHTHVCAHTQISLFPHTVPIPSAAKQIVLFSAKLRSPPSF